MNKKKIDYKNFIPNKYLNTKNNLKLKKIFSKKLKKINDSLDYSGNTLHSLSKKFKFNFEYKDIHKYKKFKTVAIIGMGGSILGTEAIYNFLKHKIKKKFIFINDIDHNELKNLNNKKNLNKILFIIISKSGNTIETLINFASLKIIKKNSKNIIIISEKGNNPLYTISQKMNLHYIEHKSYIGGRYSVLSESAMVPAYLMGLNIEKLRTNILINLKGDNKNFLKDSTIKLVNLYKKSVYKNIIYFNYSSKLNKLLYWNQQLVAESLGKKGKGFLPLVSAAPRDHHSLLQLYLDGPKDKLFYIFSEENKNTKKVNTKYFCSKLKFLNNKSFNQIKLSQKNAFIQAIKKKEIPYREFIIKDCNEEVLGELFSYFMLETSLVGKLSNIDPYNQPAVEQVKISTKKNLI